MASESKHTVKTTSTLFRIIETLLELEGAKVAELDEELAISKSTIYKHLQTLEQENYVVKDGGTYQIGLRFLGFGEYARKRRKLYQLAKPEMARLAEETGEMSNLLVEEHGRGILLHRASSDQAISLDTYAGKEVHLHANGNGKAILSCLSDDRVDEIIDLHGLPKMTENTITDRDRLFEELETIRKRGWAFDEEERLQGLRCVSIPITGVEGEVLGSVSVSGPATRLEGDRYREDIPELLQRAKNVIEMDVAYK